MGYFSSDADPKEVMRQKRSEARAIGTRMNVLFYISLASVGLAVAALIKVPYVSILGLILNIAFGIVILTIPSDSGEFRNSGIYYLISLGLQFFSNYAGVILFVLVVTIAAAVFSLMYMYSFVAVTSDSLVDADYGLSSSWETYRTAYTIMNIGLAALILLLWIRFITGEAYLFFLLCFSIFAIVLQIWMIVLLGKTGRSLIAYSNLPVTDEPETGSRYGSLRKNAPAPGSWVCSCGKVNPGYSHTCGCGKTQSQVARDKAEKRVANRNADEGGRSARRASSFNASAASAVEAKADEGKEVSAISDSAQKNVELLKELKALLDQGVLTQEEFDSKKAELLKEIK